MKRPSSSVNAVEAKRANQASKRNRETCTVLASNLPLNYNFSKVRKLFGACGEIEHIDLQKSATGDTRIARIEFKDYNDVLTALTKSHKSLGGREIIVVPIENCTLWVTNFPPSFDENDLRRLFGESGGTVMSVRLPSLRYDSHRRFAFIDMASENEATQVLNQLHDSCIEKYRLVVKLSQPSMAVKRTDSALLEKRQVLVKNLNQFKVIKQRIEEEFGRFGEIEKVTIPEPQQDIGSKSEDIKVNKGFAFIDFSQLQSAQQSLELNGKEFEGTTIEVTIADKKAFLERKAIKRLFAKNGAMENVLSLYPLDDRTSITQLQNFIVDQSKVKKTDIKEIYLAYDHHGALVVTKDASSAARIRLGVSGAKFGKRIIRCGSAKELQGHKPAAASASTGSSKILEESQRDESVHDRSIDAPTKKMTNDDFRKMFLGV
ncbi:LADA_0H05710g1_1 [Lachancea dasiensis]|uniref:LADA_0H05710g1_1 n=1 Tax=Lachancea dasiensis TaxID=1072105 RepID=A0A1G4K1C3_9SACH|nr:LADA_0H05710g1_1 [Lachancea dasiensis]